MLHCLLSCQVGPGIGDVSIRYETPDTLILRKILDINKPEHRALLQGGTNPIVAALLSPPDGNTSNTSRKKRTSASASLWPGNNHAAAAAAAAGGVAAAGGGGGGDGALVLTVDLTRVGGWLI
eukprot:jgi/Chrzof1/8254/Cz03g03090.t1